MSIWSPHPKSIGKTTKLTAKGSQGSSEGEVSFCVREDQKDVTGGAGKENMIELLSHEY